MEIIKNKQTYYGKLADFTLDSNGILRAVSKDGERSVDALKDDIALIKTIIGSGKVCMIIDNSHTKAYDIEMIRYSIREYPKLFNAVAFIPQSPIGKMISSILATLNPGTSMAIETFANEEEAVEWIHRFNKQE